MSKNEKKNKDEHEKSRHHSEEEKIKVIIDPHVEKTKNKLQALFYQKELQEVGIVRPDYNINRTLQV